MDKKVSFLYKNHTLDLVKPLIDTFILSEKFVYKLKYNIDGQISHYKVWWVAKNFQQWEKTDFEEIFS